MSVTPSRCHAEVLYVSRIIPKVIGAAGAVLLIELGELALKKAKLSERKKEVVRTGIQTIVPACIQVLLSALSHESSNSDLALKDAQLAVEV
jgi:hypothetical protein